MADLQKEDCMKNCQNQQKVERTYETMRNERKSQQEYENNIEWLGEDAVMIPVRYAVEQGMILNGWTGRMCELA
ncbi:hypothetical protein ACT7C8_17005 [Bacillus cereus]